MQQTLITDTTPDHHLAGWPSCRPSVEARTNRGAGDSPPWFCRARHAAQPRISFNPRNHGQERGRGWHCQFEDSSSRPLAAPSIFPCQGTWQSIGIRADHAWAEAEALFRFHQNSKFFHSLSITSIFSRLYGVLNVGKKITNYTV